MDNDIGEKQILALLAKEWEMIGPPGILDISDIAALVNLAPSQTMDGIKSLFANGLIDMNSLKTSVFLTPEGYEYYQEHN